MTQDTELQPLPDTGGPTPQDWGFPANPNVAQLRCWRNQERFLEAFAVCGSIGQACLETGITVANVEWWDSQDTYGFKTRKHLAAQVALGYVEREIRRRAIDGVDKPVIYRGEITDTYKEYSDNLLMFRAKRLDPAYKDNYDPRPAQQNVTITQITINPPAPAPEPQSQVVEGYPPDTNPPLNDGYPGTESQET